MSAQEARERLAELMPGAAIDRRQFAGENVRILIHGPTLADRLAQADADRLAVERVKDLANTACLRRDASLFRDIAGRPHIATVDVAALRRALDGSEVPDAS